MKHIAGKAISGFVTLIVIMGVFLFLPAWTVQYWQAWVYLFTFSVSTLLITVYLYKNDPKLLSKRVKAGATAEKQKSQQAVQAVANLFFCLLYAVAGFDHRFHWSAIPGWVSGFANIFVASGFFLVFLVFKENSYTSAIIEVDQGQKVVSTGMYAVVRHPMYLGAILMLVFSAVALGSYWSLLCVAALTVSIIVRLLGEEKFLLKNLAGYEAYCKKVNYHLIPYIW